jgi:hypothetical protein
MLCLLLLSMALQALTQRQHCRLNMAAPAAATPQLIDVNNLIVQSRALMNARCYSWHVPTWNCFR